MLGWERMRCVLLSGMPFSDSVCGLKARSAASGLVLGAVGVYDADCVLKRPLSGK